jgi:PAT family beta-lactamase induction signal transducer AmpG
MSCGDHWVHNPKALISPFGLPLKTVLPLTIKPEQRLAPRKKPYTVPMPPLHQRRRAPIWLMGLSNTTIGLVGGFIVLPLPQMLAAQGVPMWKISTVSTACLSPGFWVLLVCPVLDVRFSRRWYATFFAALAGLCLTFAVLMRAHLLMLEAAVMIAYAASVMSSNALGGWLAGVVPDVAAQDTTTPNREGATLSAWTQVGLFLGNGLMAAIAAEGIRRLPLSLIAILLGILVVLPAAIFPFIPVPLSGQDEPAKLNARESFSSLFRDLWALLKRREVLLTLLLFVAPTGSFALTNQLSAVAHDFHATDAFVGRMGGAVLTVAGAVGARLLPLLSRWVRALPLYLLIGTAGSLFTLALLLLPRSPTTFAIAFLGENIVQALSFTAAVAICFQTIGRDNPLAATQFSLLTAATVLPILYMGVVDGRTYTGHGLAGMYWIDGGLSLFACAAVGLLLWRLLPQAHTDPAAP